MSALLDTILEPLEGFGNLSLNDVLFLVA